MIRRKYLLFILSLGILFSLQACFDMPSDIQAPRFDVVLNFPITDTSYTIDDALGDDSTLVASDDPAKLGLLVYKSNTDISTFYIEDNLSINGFSTRASQVIGSIKINDVKPVQTGIAVTQWTNGVQPGQQMVFPENVGEVNVGFPRIDAFKSVSLDGGTLTIKVVNRLPVDMELRGLKILNADDGSIFAQKPYPPAITLPKLDSTVISFDLTGKTIMDSLIYNGTLYTPGSGGNVVDIPAEAGTEITASFDNLSISGVSAVLPAQDPFSKDSTVVIDDSTFIESAVFDQGSFAITLDNGLDLDIDLQLTIDNLLDANSNSFSQTVFLSAKETGKQIGVNDLSGWSISTLTPGTPTNQLSYSAVISPRSSNDVRTISKNDSIGIGINFGDIVFRSVAGKIKPTTISIAQSEFGFDLGDLKNSFNYTDINFNDPAILLSLKTSAQMEFELNGFIEATNGAQTKSMNLNNVIISSSGSNTIDLRDYGFKDFLNGFDSAIPDSFKFAGDATVNPNFAVGSVSKDDSVSGAISIEIPLDIGIAGGTFRDTVNIDSISIDDKQIDAINFAEITIEMTNAIPVGISFSGHILDANNNPLIQLPPSYNDISAISIVPPTVDSDGLVTAPSQSKQVIRLTGEDAKTFIHNPNIEMVLTLDTPPAGTADPVKFRTTDYISVKLYGSAGYRVNN